MTGEEYLHFCCHARKIEWDIVSNFNIFRLPLKKYVSEYSKGMKKKLAFQGILLQKNSFFLLDEPFNGVDLFSSMEIKNTLLAIKSEQKIILMSSHVLSILTDICYTIFYLKRGMIEREFEKYEFDKIELELMKITD